MNVQMRRTLSVPWAGLIGMLIQLSPGFAGVWAATEAPNPFDQTVTHPAIPILDEAGKHVLESGLPYSPRMTCGNGNGAGCHDYDKMKQAAHFEQGRNEANDLFGAKRGLPHLTSPGYFGGYNCMSGSNPAWLAKKSNASVDEFGDIGSAGYLKLCQGCHSGGGWAEKDRNGQRYDQTLDSAIAPLDGDYFDRQVVAAPGGDHGGHGGAAGATEVVRWDWKKSGVKEIDCMTCHTDFKSLKKFPASQLGANDGKDKSDPATAHWNYLQDTKFTKSGFFRYADTALWEFINVRPDLPEGLSLLNVQRELIPNTTKPDYKLATDAAGNPILHWHKDGFDAQGKVKLPMLRFPASENCMVCHLTGNSRRGFYGFGKEAEKTLNPDGTLVPDPKDDVHKGVTWTEDNGEVRKIENCNACHAKEYFKSTFANVNLNADHNFPKGNGDTDVRNDLDSMPPAKSCEHCHDQAKSPALPSGQKTALDAHRELWKANGDMAGYSEESLNKIAKTHLDTVACQTCHITGLAYNGTPIPIHYRFRFGDDRKMKIFPYKPAYRYYAQEKKSGRVLYQWERNAVFEKKTGTDGKDYGAIVDPSTHGEIGKVSYAGGRFGEPSTYADFKALKQAYDSLMKAKGYADADVKFVYIESNDYAITHNTRPSPQALECAACHARKQSGAFSSLVSPNGLLGEGRVIQVAKLPDRRLVDEGVFELGMPYYQVDDAGRITENAADVLYASKLDPSMSILKAETARVVSGQFKTVPADEGAGYLGVLGDAGTRLMQRMNSGEWLLFNSRVGHSSLRGFALILPGNQLNQALANGLRAEAETREAKPVDRKRIRKTVANNLASDIYTLTVAGADKAPLTRFQAGDAQLKLPYLGRATEAKQVRVVYSDDGKRWRNLPKADLVELQPNSPAYEGYLILRTQRPYANLAITDKVKKVK